MPSGQKSGAAPPTQRPSIELTLTPPTVEVSTRMVSMPAGTSGAGLSPIGVSTDGLPDGLGDGWADGSADGGPLGGPLGTASGGRVGEGPRGAVPPAYAHDATIPPPPKTSAACSRSAALTHWPL